MKQPQVLLLNLLGIGSRSMNKMAAESYSQGIVCHKNSPTGLAHVRDYDTFLIYLTFI